MKSSLDVLSYFTVVIIHNNSFLNKPFSPLPKDVVTGFLFLFSQSRISARFVGHLVPFMQGRIATDFLPFSPKGHLFLFSLPPPLAQERLVSGFNASFSRSHWLASPT